MAVFFGVLSIVLLIPAVLRAQTEATGAIASEVLAAWTLGIVTATAGQKDPLQFRKRSAW